MPIANGLTTSNLAFSSFSLLVFLRVRLSSDVWQST